MKIQYMHLCDHAIIDRLGKASAIGIFGAIASPTFPTVHPGMFLLFETVAKGSEINVSRKIRIDITTPDGKPLFRVDGDIIANGVPAPTNRVISAHAMQIPPLRFDAPGDYGVAVFIDGKPEFELPLGVIQQAHPGQNP